MNVAVSACLIGEKIRYDQSSKTDKFIVEKLGKFVDFVPFCPEHVAFGTPRETIRIVLEKDEKKIYTVFSKEDVTSQINQAVFDEFEKIKANEVCGIILKSKSPSCGLGSTKYYTKEMGEGKKDGLFASTCKAYFVDFPVEEEARLLDPWLRENFVMQLFAYDEAIQAQKNIAHIKALVAFHTAYKFLLHSKNEPNYRLLGNIVANHEKETLSEVKEKYFLLFKQTIAIKSKISQTVNVLEHMAGFFKNDLNAIEKEDLHTQIADFHHEVIPLIAVMSTIEFLAKKYQTSYLLGQRFLNPYPKELALRSQVQLGK